jgi:endonuclease YncB( thermonuclease family)
MRLSEHLKKASLVGAFFVSAFLAVPALALCPTSERLETAPVAKVLDGDTLRLVDGRSVRLIGLNTPEMGRKGRAAEPYAKEARQRLQQLVDGSGGKVGLRPGRQTTDRYGRLLAHAYDARGHNLEAALLAEGLGYFVAISPNTALVACHQAAERRARSAARGVWRLRPVQPARNLNTGGFAILSGRVTGLERNRGGVWLQLDGPVVLQVPAKALRDFDALLRTLRQGSSVEVRGWVIDRRAREGRKDRAPWLLPVTHPSMLSVRH